MNGDHKLLIVDHITNINKIKAEINEPISKDRINELLDIIARSQVCLIIKSAEAAHNAREGILFNQFNTNIIDINKEYDALTNVLFNRLTDFPINNNGFDKYQELRENLTPYISITTEDLKKLINGIRLQPGAAKWIGKKADAYRFAYWLNPAGTTGHKNFKAFFNNNIEGVKIHGNQGKDLQIELTGSVWDALKQFKISKILPKNNK